ncbi:uncharacterized protein LOC106461936, partial [Limulus polyphemus]|uniref:Uncharacterized protein LOC106461936 n=1 Tax=Limulus polyphemus TaxID=6850 RepID=A0ABM1B905_LIMPO
MYATEIERNIAEDSDKPEWLKELIMKKGTSGRASSSLVKLVDRNRAASSSEPLKQSTQESKCEGTKAATQVIHPSKTETSSVNTPGSLNTCSNVLATSRVLTFHRAGGGTVPGTEESVPAKVVGVFDVPVSASSSGLFSSGRSPVSSSMHHNLVVGHGHTLTSDFRTPLVARRPASDKMGEDYTTIVSEHGDVNGSTFERSKINSPTSSSTFSDLSHNQPSSSDESEQELEYGPGIVDKLKSRFISISLREKPGRANGALRRYSSMENLLDKDTSMFQVTGLSTLERPLDAGSRANGNLPMFFSNMKKVKSMETLLFESEKTRKHNVFSVTSQPVLRITNQKAIKRPRPNCPQSMLINEDVVIIENNVNTEGSNNNLPSWGKVFKRRDVNRQTSTMSITDDELPKPDTVRNYKRLFEPLDKKSTPQSNVRRKPPVVRAIATFSGSKFTNTIANSGTQETEIAQQISKQQDSGESVLSQQDGVESSCNIKHAKNSAKGLLTNGNQSQVQVDDICQKTEVTQQQTHYTELHNNREENGTEHALNIFGSENVNMTFESQQNYKENNVEKGSDPEVRFVPSGTFTSEVSSTVNPPLQQKLNEKPVANIKPIPKSNQSASVHSSKENLPISHVISTKIDKRKMVPGELEGKLINESVGSEYSNTSIVAKQKQTPVTDIEAGDVPKPNALLGNKKPWQKPPASTSSVVFDFRGKSVKTNVALTPAPFGCKPIKVAKKVRVDGKESKNGIVNGMVTDGSDVNDFEDEDFEFEDQGLSADLPHPSGIVFEGENVIIGKGALLTVKNKKLNIQFDDNATSTFEYPSETCLPSPTISDSSSPSCSPTDELQREVVQTQEPKSSLTYGAG